MMYTICWIDPVAVTKGHGEQPLTEPLALAWLKAMQEKYPHMTHTMVPVGPNGEAYTDETFRDGGKP